MAARKESSLPKEELKRQLEEKGLTTTGSKAELLDRLHTHRFQHLRVKTGFRTAKFKTKEGKKKTVYAKPLDLSTGFSVFYFPPIRESPTDPVLYFSEKVEYTETSEIPVLTGKHERVEMEDDKGDGSVDNSATPLSLKKQRQNVPPPVHSTKKKSVLIVVAKDHEYNVIREAMNSHAAEWNETKADAIFERGHFTRYSSYSEFSLVIACAYCFGEHAIRMFAKFLRHFDPDFVLTIGCCAGPKPDRRSKIPVYIITEAVSTIDPTIVRTQNHHAVMDMFRSLKEQELVEFIGRPDADTRTRSDVCKILSVHGETIDDPTKLDELLAIHDSSCLDMEVFFFFELVRNENHKRREEGRREITLLPALKGYSDHADKEEREKMMRTAVTKATVAAIYMLRSM